MYDEAKEYILHHLVDELMKLFRSKEVDDADNLADRQRALTMLLENTRTAPEFQDITSFLSQSHQQQVHWSDFTILVVHTNMDQTLFKK